MINILPLEPRCGILWMYYSKLAVKGAGMIRNRLILAAFVLCAPAFAHSYQQKGIEIGHAWSLPTDSSEAMAFFPLLNTGPTEDRLIAMTSPFAKSITYVDRFGTVQANLPLQPKLPVALRKGGAHIRLTGLTRALKLGSKIPLTLSFEKAGRITIEVWIEPAPYAKSAQH
jgi:periplasmic copper chaperone A